MRPTFRQYLLLAALFFGCLAAYIDFFPQLYMHRIFPLWRARLALIEGRDDFSLLVLGDSRPLTAILPRGLPGKAVNLALEGASTIEPLFLFRRYLERHPPPDTVIYSVSPIRFLRDEYFWENTAKARALGLNDLLEIQREADALHDSDFTGWSSQSCSSCATLRILATWAGLPFLFQHNLEYASLFLRGAENRELESAQIRDLGYLAASSAPSMVSRPGREANHSEFKPSPVLSRQFDEFLRLAASKNVRSYFIYLPTNPASAASISSDFKDGFRAFLEIREKKFPLFRVIGSFRTLAPAYFADQDHLNREGAELITGELAAALRPGGSNP
jgi:hypothetical protein